MATTAVSSASIFQELQSFYQNRQADIQQLGADLKSGNLSAAQHDFTTLAALGESGPFANSEPFSNSSRANAFNTLGEALQAGDLTRAQTAFASLTGSDTAASAATATSTTAATATTTTTTAPATVVNLASTQPGTASGTTAGASTTTAASSIYEQLRAYRQQRTADVAQLGQDLQAGNLTAAQTDFNTLTALGQTGPFQNGQPFQLSNRAQDFQAIGQALTSGDLSAAQTSFTALENTFAQNQQAQNAISAYTSGTPTITINLEPQVTSTSATPSTATTAVPEIVINLGATSGAGNSNSSAPEIVINLEPVSSSSASSTPTNSPSSTSSAPEVVLNLGGTQSGTASGSSAPEVVINLDQANASSTENGGGAEILINLAAVSNSGTSTGSTAPEVEINLNAGSNSSATPSNGVTISLGNSGSGEQLTIDGAQGANGGATHPITINLNPQNNYELILNLLNPGTTGSASNALSVSA